MQLNFCFFRREKVEEDREKMVRDVEEGKNSIRKWVTM